MSKRYIYEFDHADEYEDIAPCKFCGARPYANIAGIFCKECGYSVERVGKTNGQVTEEWNAARTDGKRAEFACAVSVSEE